MIIDQTLAIVLPSGTINLMKMNGQIKEQAEAPFLLHKHKSATLNTAAAAAAPPPPPLLVGTGFLLDSSAAADWAQARWQTILSCNNRICLGRGSRNGSSGVAVAAESARARRREEFASTRRAEKARARRENLPPSPPPPTWRNLSIPVRASHVRTRTTIIPLLLHARKSMGGQNNGRARSCLKFVGTAPPG